MERPIWLIHHVERHNESIVHLVLVTFIRVLQILTQPLVFSKRARLAQQDKFLWKSTTLDFISDINVITFLRPTPFFSSGMAITYNATKHFSLSFFFWLHSFSFAQPNKVWKKRSFKSSTHRLIFHSHQRFVCSFLSKWPT